MNAGLNHYLTIFDSFLEKQGFLNQVLSVLFFRQNYKWKVWCAKSEESILFDPEMSVLLFFSSSFLGRIAAAADKTCGLKNLATEVKLLIEFPYLNQIIFNWHIFISKATSMYFCMMCNCTMCNLLSLGKSHFFEK